MAPRNNTGMLDVAMGLVLVAYVVYCIARGRINARVFGAKARPVLRTEQPVFFWFVVSGHIAVALIIIFVL